MRYFYSHFFKCWVQLADIDNYKEAYIPAEEAQLADDVDFDLWQLEKEDMESNGERCIMDCELEQEDIFDEAAWRRAMSDR